jgi:restriction system protein
MESLIAIFSILYIFWPFTLFLGIRKFFQKELPLKERFIQGFQRTFIGWVLMAFFLVFILWQGHQPILLLPQHLNHLLFSILGILTGGISFILIVLRWRSHRRRLSDARTLDDLMALSPDEFEKLIATIFKSYGHQAQIHGGSSDHGVDILVSSSNDEKWIIQCKRYSGSVGEPVVRDLYGTMNHESAQRAYLITTGSFTAQAKAWAEGKPIVLYDGEALVKLIQRTQVHRSQWQH